MVRVIKKDHTKEAFNIQKVVIAVNKSANRVLYTFTEDELKAICGHVEGYIRDHGMTEVQIWQMHNIVELRWRPCGRKSPKLSRLPQLQAGLCRHAG